MKKRKLSNPNRKKNIAKTIIATIIMTIYCITIGYSTNSATATIEDLMASVRPQAYVRITNVALSGTSNDGLSNAEDYNLSSIYGTVELPNQNSTVTYKVDVTVFLSSEMMIKSITGLSENLEYQLTDYTIGDILCDSNNQCNFGATKEFYITIKYKENGFNSSQTTYPYRLDFLFDSNNKIAKIGNRYFDTLQDAIDTITTDNTETYVYLLNDTVENISAYENQNIVLNLQGNSITNAANAPVISNNATLKLLSGNVNTTASTNGAINNEAKGRLTLDSVRVEVSGTGNRQALYNNKGIATIKGNSYLSSISTARAAVQNVSGGTMYIESGKIVSTGFHGVVNAGTLNIGIKDGNVDGEYPEIQGIKDGVNASAVFSYYDGVIKGKDNAVNNEARFKEYETGYTISHSTESIDGITYKVLTLAEAWKITYYPNGGTVSPTSKLIVKGEKLGSLPTPTRSGYKFLGWYTAQNGGNKVNSNTEVNGDLPLYAHWEKNRNTARMNGVIYDTLQDAVNAAPNGTQTTIELLENVSEKITINVNKNLILDLGTSTLSNNGNNPVIENNGTLRIINGSIYTSGTQGAINQNQGLLVIGNTTITATSNKQALYISGGTAEITSGAYLTSQTYGTPDGSTMERGTVQCLANGTLIITGGTIVGEKQQAVSNEGTLTIGTKDGNLTTDTPILIGAVHGVRSSTSFNFYNGIMKGQTDAYQGTIVDIEDSSRIATGTELIDSKTYYTAFLEAN